MNYTIDEFVQMQMVDLEKIGLTGDLFRDVWKEYKRQGKTMQQMQHDLIEYQIMIEQKIIKQNKRKLKKEKRKRHEEEKEHKEKKKKKHKSPRKKHSSPEKKENKGASKLKFNYDVDSMEDSVFVEQFKVQDRD